jgi:hypothetical protein
MRKQRQAVVALIKNGNRRYETGHSRATAEYVLMHGSPSKVYLGVGYRRDLNFGLVKFREGFHINFVFDKRANNSFKDRWVLKFDTRVIGVYVTCGLFINIAL